MPKHYAIGINYQTGVVSFSNTKQMTINFTQQFNIVPAVTLTMYNLSTSIPYKYQITKTSLVVKFQTPYTGEVGWQAMEGLV